MPLLRSAALQINKLTIVNHKKADVNVLSNIKNFFLETAVAQVMPKKYFIQLQVMDFFPIKLIKNSD